MNNSPLTIVEYIYVCLIAWIIRRRLYDIIYDHPTKLRLLSELQRIRDALNPII